MAAALPGAGSPTSAPSTQPTTQPGRFVVATYNINYGNVDLKQTVATIRKAGADLVCLQETNKQSEPVLRQALAREYPYMHFHGSPAVAGGFAILAKSPLKNVRVLPRKFGFFDTLLAEVDLGGKAVTLANVHLLPTIPGDDDNLLAMMRLFLKTEAVRGSEIELIHRNLPKDKPVILLGDFNSIPNTAVPRYLADAGLTDSFAAVTKDPDKHVTWHWKRGKTEWRFRLDYVFHSPHFKTAASGIIESDSSDHHLVASTLTWAARPATQASQPASR